MTAIALPLAVGVHRKRATDEPVWVRWTLIGLAFTFLTLFLFYPPDLSLLRGTKERRRCLPGRYYRT